MTVTWSEPAGGAPIIYFTISYTTGPAGTRWTSIWPTTAIGLRGDLANLLNAAKTADAAMA